MRLLASNRVNRKHFCFIALRRKLFFIRSSDPFFSWLTLKQGSSGRRHVQSDQEFHLIASNGDTLELTGNTLIGRSHECDIVLTGGHPSRRHAQLELENGLMYVQDLRSANGTFVNRIQIHSRQLLVDGDRLAFGLTNFMFSHRTPKAIEAEPTDPDATRLLAPEDLARSHRTRFVLRNYQSDTVHELLGPTVLGRLPEMTEGITLVLDNPGVSSTHARLTPRADGVLVEDLDSGNGTFVNDVRVMGSVLAKADDTLRFHLLELSLEDTQPKLSEEMASPHNKDLEPESEPEIGRKGGTVMLPINPNLPPLWDERPTEGTAMLNPSERAELAQNRPAISHENLGRKLDAATLLILSGGEAGRPIKLNCQGDVNYWNIGRNPNTYDLSIVLDDPSVSDLHAKLICREGRWKIIDQMSTNALFINGKRHSSAYLRSSDHIRIGRIDSMLLLPDEPTDGLPAATLGWLSRLLKRLGERE